MGLLHAFTTYVLYVYVYGLGGFLWYTTHIQISQDERLHSLGTSAQGAKLFGFWNGQVKFLCFELVSLVRTVMCAKHTVRLNL